MTEFKSIKGGDHLPFEGEPVAVFRFLTRIGGPEVDEVYFQVDEAIEDPETCDFFFVLEALDIEKGDHYLCEHAGRKFICRWINPPATIGNFSKFSMPLIRKSYPQLIASKLVGVQPMQQPASLLYYLRYQYAKNKGQKPNV